MPDATSHQARRLAATLLLVGAVLLLLGNTIHPIDSEASTTSRLVLAGSSGWMPIHLAIAAGILAVGGAFAVLPAAITDARAVLHARLAAAAALVGATTLAIVFAALDGYGQAALADALVGGAEPETLEAAALVLDIVDSGITAIGIVALFGAAMAALGGAIVMSGLVGRWLGWVAIGIGLAGTLTGVLFATMGSTPFVINGLFRPVAMGATLFFIVLAVALWRSPVQGPAGTATAHAARGTAMPAVSGPAAASGRSRGRPAAAPRRRS